MLYVFDCVVACLSFAFARCVLLCGCSKSDYGAWKWGPGEWFTNEAEANGIAPSQTFKFYAISSKIATPFTNKDKDLIVQVRVRCNRSCGSVCVGVRKGVACLRHASPPPCGVLVSCPPRARACVQFTAKYEKNEYSFCGGGYIKLLPATLDPKEFNGDSEYQIMFGPDRCGYDVSRIHAIFNHEGKNLLKKDDIKLEYNDKDALTHLYTLIVHPDNTYEVLFDQTSKSKGSMIDGWAFEPKQIDDPTDKKPKDWVDEAKIPDPTDEKPEGYDDIPKQIPDPAAEKPDDWNEEDDGEWEAPTIANPAYKGEWKPKMIDNPAYKGVWKAKQIDNPKYKDNVYEYSNIGYVGLDLWIVNDGTIFDNIIITDSKEEADAHAAAHWAKIKKGEKEEKEAFDKKKKDAEEAAKKTETKDEDEDDEDEDDGADEL